jgi:hypothetical protein
VQLSEHAKRHYVKAFEKRYTKKQWDITLRSIYADLARIEEYLKYDKAETIHDDGVRKIIKLYFRVAQTKDSAKGSGNRAIVLIEEGAKVATILLIYSKNEIAAPNETAKWQSEVKDNFLDLRSLVA